MKISTKKLQNIQLQITFLFSNKNDENELIIYQKTIQEVMKLYKQDRFYISFNRNIIDLGEVNFDEEND